MAVQRQLVTLVLLGTLSVVGVTTSFLLSRDRVPRSWNVREMAVDSNRGEGLSATQVKVLDWSIKKREGVPSAEMDEAILSIEGSINGKSAWGLSHVYRNLSDPNPHWREVLIFDVTIPGSRDFDHPPSPLEIRQFLQDTHWDQQ
ncbi:MAG TPA: hypothetical protein VNV60_02890 [Holophagaceae bacterium]|nr:hypothetical protein [Holophagaceae bacterium]